MYWDLRAVVTVTGARVVRWSGPEAVILAHGDMRVGPNTLYVPWRPSAVSLELFDYLSYTGAAGIILDEGQELPSVERHPYLGVLTVPSAIRAYAQLARHLRQRHSSILVGVTGSVGKTSTASYLRAILGTRYKIHATQSSINRSANCCGLVMGLTGAENEAAIVEMGFSDPGDIDIMAFASIPNAGIITAIAPQHLAHVDGLVERVAEEKSMMARHLAPGGFMVVRDADLLSGLLKASSFNCAVLRVGQGPGNDLGYDDVRVTELGTTCTLLHNGKKSLLHLRTVGPFQAANAAFAALVASRLGVPWQDILAALESTEPVRSRFNVYRFRQGLTIIDDSYSSGYYAFVHGADTAAYLAGDRRKVAFTSRMTSLGDYGLRYHRLAAEHLVKRGFSDVVIVGDDPDALEMRKGLLIAGLPDERIRIIQSAKEIAPTLAMYARPNTLIYCKIHYYVRASEQVLKFFAELRESGF